MNNRKDTEILFTRRGSVALLVALVSMTLLPLLTHALINHPPEYDELLHILSARSMSATGIPAIADGVYSRAEIYTRLIAWVTQFGDNELLVARLPALVCGVILTAVVSAWVSVRAGWLAGLAAAAVLVISPGTLHASVLVRFYTAHTLIMTVLLILWYESTTTPRTARNMVVLLLVSAGLIALGLALQALTLITAMAGVCGVVMLLLFDARSAIARLVEGRMVLVSAVLILVAAGSLWVFVSMDLISLLRVADTPLWSVEKAGNYAYYVSAMAVQLPFIWPLFPVMLVFAFRDNPRLVVFCLTVFLAALVVNSLAAQKATRYFYHVFPMFCVLWGIGFQKLVSYVAGELQARRGIRVQNGMILVLLLSAVCLVNAHEVKRGLKLLVDRGEMDDTIPVNGEPDWLLALPDIGELANSVETLVVTSGVKGLYAFGRYDYEMSTTVVQETDSGRDFGMDPRTGRQAIGAPESVNRIIDAEGQALFVLENRMLNRSYSATMESVAVLKQRCQAIDLTSSGSQLSAWLC